MNPASQETPKRPGPRWDSLAAMLGGALWVVFYGVSVWMGRTLGGEPLPEQVPWPYPASFCGAIFCLSASLVGLQRRLEGHEKKLGLPALGLAGVGLLVAFLNLVMLTGLLGPTRFMGGLAALGVFSLCISATLLGVATRREPVQPRWASTLLLTTGVLTVLLIFASGQRFGSVPAYIVDDLPFALSGSAWLVLGLAPRG
jgi:hypothetical protein